MLSKDILSTPEDTSSEFDKMLAICFKYEEALDESPQKYELSIEIFKKIEKSVIMHGIFSPNEDITEIYPENLK